MDNRLVARFGGIALVIALAGGAFALHGDGEPAGSSVTADTLDLDWEHLLPEETTTSLMSGVVEHEQVSDDGSPWQQMTDVSQVRTDLNGKHVRIPGYMTPLSFDDAEVGEFLLVPYVGACVHVPPPAANQIVYVKVDGTVPVLEMWEPFLAVGTLRTEPQSTELAEVGYTMKLDHLEIMEEPEVDVYDDLAGDPPGAEPS